MEEAHTASAPALSPDADLAPLRPYWHPVAYAREMQAHPIPVVVLGQPVVVIRTAEGLHAFGDLCPHRGAKLSGGRVVDGRLVCPYHGFRYETDGSCGFIPSQPPGRERIPSRLRLERLRAQERYGIVWVALEEPRLPIPAFAEFDDPGFRAHPSMRAESWNASAARWMENFLDITHLAHVHPGILGDPEQPVCEPYEVQRTPTGLRYDFVVLQQYDESRWPSEANDHRIDVEPAATRARLFLPFTVSFTVDGPGGRWVTFRTGLPVSASRVRFFTVQARNHLFDESDEKADALAHFTAEQDRVVTESQHPEMLPVDLTEEVHLRIGDAIGIAYRRALRELGLTYA